MNSRPEPRLVRRTRSLGLAVGLATASAGVGAGAVDSGSSPGATETVRQLKSLSFEELMEVRVATVYAASKREQKVTEAPASVSVVTADEIRKHGYRTLAEVLRGVRGFYVTNDRSYSYLGVRGVSRPGDYGGRVLVLIGGHRLNDPIYGEAFNGGEFPLDMDLVERVEVVRGPGHSLYGDNAFLAVINVIPKQGARIDGLEASTSAASFDTYSGRLTYGTRTKGGLDVLMSGTLLESAGHDELRFPEFASSHGGVSTGLDAERIRQIFASASYEGLSLAGFLGERVKEVPTAEYDALFDEGPNFTRDRRWGTDLRLERDLDEDWHLLTRLYLDGYQFEGVGPYAAALPGYERVLNRDLAESLFWGAEAEVSRTLLRDHQVALGLSYRDDLELRQRNWDHYTPLVMNMDARGPTSAEGVYLQDDYAVLRNLTASAAVRYDHFSSFGDTVNPRAGLIWNPAGDTVLKALFAQAFRSPNAYERTYDIEGYVGNPDLKPERIHSWELVWEQGFGPRWRTSASLFLHDMTDFVTPTLDTLGNYTFENLDAVCSQGAEFEVEGRWAHGLSLRLSYTFADTREHALTGDGVPANSPRHLAKAAVTLPVWRDQVFVSLELQGMSERVTVRGDEVPGFVTSNVTLFSRELIRNLELSAGIWNLFDVSYRDPVASDFRQSTIEQDGRTFRAKLTYRF